MADDHLDHPDSPSDIPPVQGKPPAPRRRSAGRSGKVRFHFRETDKKKPMELREEEEAAAAAYEAAELGPRPMLPDGSPALTRKQRKQAKRTQKQPRPPKKKSKIWTLIPIAFGLLLLAVLALGGYSYWTDPARSDVYFDGVYVGGVYLGGMTQEQAAEALADDQARILGGWRVTLNYDGTQRIIRAGDIAMELDLSEQLAEAWMIGREGSYTQRRQAVEALSREPYHATSGITYDQSMLDAVLERLRADIDLEPTDATATFWPQNEQPFQYVDEAPGRRLNVENLRSQVEGFILSIQNADIQLQPEVIPPKVTRAMLQNNLVCIVVVNTDVSSASTDNRNQNMRIALNALNGQMVAPGERLSFNQVAGKRSDPKNGYMEALEIAYGEHVTGIGGGVCQVSTTLYQAALRAGLQIVDRSPHAIPSDYADKGQDATVSDNGSDLVIRNGTEYPVYIRARLVEDQRARTRRCEVSIYGRPLPEGTRYTLESRLIGGDILPEPDTEYIADRRAEHVVYTDQQKQVSDMRPGYRVETFLVTNRADGPEASRERISEDLYKPRPARVYVGVTPRDEE